MILIVNNTEFRGLNKYTITQSYNSIASSFSIDLDKQILDYVLSYPKCELYSESGDLLLTGIVFIPAINITSVPQPITITGYSLPGVLEDCTIPISIYPLQFDNLSLFDITEKLLKPFGLGYDIVGDVTADLNKKYDKTSADPSSSIKQYLNDLASQRNIYLSNNEFGELVYTRYDSNKFLPTAFYEEGLPGLKQITLNIASQALHSDITIIRQATKKNPDAAQATISNPYVDTFRPTVIINNSGDIFDVDKAARNALSTELSNIKFNLKVTKYAKPGTTIELKAPSINLNKSTELFVEQTVINGTTQDTDLYELTCVLTDVYKNDVVKNVFI